MPLRELHDRVGRLGTVCGNVDGSADGLQKPFGISQSDQRDASRSDSQNGIDVGATRGGTPTRKFRNGRREKG